eukprot:scaffold81177_cov20-Prasinocladus_malaysianus.AAC.1
MSGKLRSIAAIYIVPVHTYSRLYESLVMKYSQPASCVSLIVSERRQEIKPEVQDVQAANLAPSKH